MNYTNEKAETLRQQVYSKESIRAKLAVIYKRRQELKIRLDELDKIRIKEQQDVDNLEKFSLASILSSITGNKVEKLEKERDEAYAAALKYETALKEFNAVCDNITYYENELEKIGKAEEEYEAVINEKFTQLKQSGHPKADEIMRLDRLVGRMQNEIKEIDEALAIGTKAKSSAERITAELENAENSADEDILSQYSCGRAKYTYLSNAQEELNLLQVHLSRFRTDLADVRSIDADLQLEINDFLSFADIVLENFISEIIALNKIRKSLESAEKMRDKIISTIYRLEEKRDQLQSDIKEVRKQLENLVIDTPL